MINRKIFFKQVTKTQKQITIFLKYVLYVYANLEWGTEIFIPMIADVFVCAGVTLRIHLVILIVTD